MTAIASQAQAKARECLSFALGTEEYGIDILKAREIPRYETFTKIADSPDFLKGVINLRGLIVPVVDMGIKFRLDQASYNQFTVVIVPNVTGRVTGMVVDGASDVISLSPEQIRPAQELSASLDTQHGIGVRDQRMIIVADIERLMCALDLPLCEQAAA